MCDLRDIQRWCGPTTAGITEINIIVPGDVLTLPKAYCTPLINSDLEFKPEKRAYVIKADRKSVAFNEKSNNDRSGDIFDRSFSFSINRDRPDVADLAEKLKNRRFHVLYRDRNVYGKLLTNMRVVTDTANGPQWNGRNGTIFNFTGRSEKKAPFYGGTLSGEIVVDNSDLVLVAPNGKRYLLEVDNCGALVTTLIIP